MVRGALAAVVAGALFLHAEAIPARAKPSEYKTHQVLPKVTVAADFHMHTIPAGRRSYLAEDYLVVEVAVYPAGRNLVMLSSGHFLLRLNRKKPGLFAQSPGFVSASMKYPDWEQRRNVEVAGGVGDAGVILGRPPVEPRFPGDQRPPRRPLPAPPKAPDGGEGQGVEVESELTPAETVQALALLEGEINLPAAGLLYFPYRGKLKGARTVELVYSSPLGEAVLKLQ
jgi:hypothetical protein